MKFFYIFFILLTTMPVLQAQVPTDISKYQSHATEKKLFGAKTLGTLSETCGNNIDDDGNGLTDMKDFSCYFSVATPDTCIPSKVVWASFWSRLYWVDMETNTDRVMNFPLGENYDDLTWAPNGKLYGAERWTGQVREIDPNTAQTQFVSDVPGHYYSNGMTADAQSNLYLCSYTMYGLWHIVKLNLTTGQADVIADLSANNLVSAGDLTFLDGFLYVACMDSKIAKVNIATGNVQVVTYTGAGSTGSMGLITLGDGYLYTCHQDDIFRLDPVTWEATLYYHFPTYGFSFGMTSYSEFCNAPGCRAKLSINVQTSAPFCSNKGVVIKGIGTGIKGSSGYTWRLPDGQKRTGDSLTAYVSGKYYLRYHTLPDTCGTVDSITINVIQYPTISLGKDTVLCTGSTLQLAPIKTAGVTSYLWQDGSTSMNYSVTNPGTFWVEGSNACGTKRDSILVNSATFPKVFIGPDTLLCSPFSIGLKNTLPKQLLDHYTWSTGSIKDSITISQPGNYWLQTSNTCGTIRDSIKIISKDSCTCQPFYALANLGTDRELCQYDTVVLKNSLGQKGFSYVWQDGSKENYYIVKQPGIYWADVTTYCNTIRDTVIISEKTNDCECSVYLPNAFTPNNDGKNDLFKPLANCPITGQLKIYNRWGQIVYESNNLQNGWDGNFRNIRQPKDNYIYQISYKFANRPNMVSKKGNFILIR